jgi:CheY-like chemotaxis protein
LWVKGDRVRLIQVLANLLNNAAKFQEKGGQVEVTVAREGTEWVVAVRDRGVGIDPDKLPDVFDLFSQVESTLDRAQGGLGIGLALVRSIVEMHGGSVHAESAGRGQGSQFIVRLNRSEPRAAARKAPPVGRDALERGGPPRRVLLVDDNRDASESLAILLTMTGHEVVTAGDGPQALEILRQHDPDVILLDIGLPGMDGYKVCRRIRGEELSAATIVAMTGFGQDRDRELAKAAGFDAHLVKPVAIGRLLSLLDGLPARPVIGAEAAPPRG